MYEYQIELVTMADCKNFTDALNKAGKTAQLTDSRNFCVSANSLLGAIASLEWDRLYVQSNEDIYNIISKWVK